MWSFILFFYVRRLWSPDIRGQLIHILLIILAIDAFRTLFESMYFGAWYSSLAGFLPKPVHGFLVRPELVFIPKIINVIAAIAVIGLLLYRWLPEEEEEKKRFMVLIEKNTWELKKSNELLQKEIEERKRTEKALRESEEKYRELLENSPDLRYRTDNNGNIIYISPSVHKFAGYTVAEATGKNLWNEICKYSNDHDEMLTILKEKGSIENFEVEFLHKEGSSWWASTSAQFFRDADGNILGVEGVIRDVTEQKRLAEQLRQSHKVEAVGTLASGISHDFNNILGIIVGNADLASDDIPEGHPAHECLEDIKIASLRAAEVIKQLLNFSRKRELNRSPVNIKSVVEESIKLLRSSLPAMINIQLRVPEVVSIVKADLAQIQQIIINLCTNSAHAMEEGGGVLTVTIQQLETLVEFDTGFKKMPPGKYLQLVVSDTGTGIKQENIKKIFDPYFTTKEFGKGTGMGLASVLGIVENHYGAISVYSELGQGTSVKIMLPTIEEVPVIESKVSEAVVSGNERILIIDDEESMLKMGEKTLTRMGYSVETCLNPLDALKLVRAAKDKFDLIITDVTMPNMTGDILIEKIHSIRSNIPVILCTGFSERINSEGAYQIGASGYIEKPFDKIALSASVRTALDYGQ